MEKKKQQSRRCSDCKVLQRCNAIWRRRRRGRRADKRMDRLTSYGRKDEPTDKSLLNHADLFSQFRADFLMQHKKSETNQKMDGDQ